jgi:hypothetical protein
VGAFTDAETSKEYAPIKNLNWLLSFLEVAQLLKIPTHCAPLVPLLDCNRLEIQQLKPFKY